MPRRRKSADITPLPLDGFGRDRLPYPYFYDIWLKQGLAYDPVEPVGEFNGVCDIFTVALTAEEQLKFSSALMLGAMLAYPTEWMNIWAAWDSAMALVNTYETGGCSVTTGDTFCDRVLACIEDNPPGDQPGLDDFQDIEAQQKAVVCGSIEFAVEEIIQQGEVVLDFVEAAASVANALADILQHYGRFGAIPTAVQGAVSGLIGAVAAARSEWQAQTTEDAIRCGLYCAVIEAGGPPYTLSEDTLGNGYDAALEELGPLTLKGLVLEATWYFIPKRLLASRFQVGVDQSLSSGLCDTLCEPCVIVPICRGLSFFNFPYRNNNPNLANEFVIAGPTWLPGEGYTGNDFTVDVDFSGSPFSGPVEADINKIQASFGGIGTGNASYTIYYKDTSNTYVQVGSGSTGNGTVAVNLASFVRARGIRIEADREFFFELTGVAVDLDPATVSSPSPPWYIQGPCA